MNTATLPAELSELRELVVTLKAALELSRQENSLLRQKLDVDAWESLTLDVAASRLDREQTTQRLRTLLRSKK